MTLRQVARAWAKADRDADDRCADVDRAEAAIVAAVDSGAPKPQQEALCADRDGVVAAFKETCIQEKAALDELQATARRLLDEGDAE